MDDIRYPIECSEYMYKRVGNGNLEYLTEWHIVRTLEDFKDYIYLTPGIDLISLDYDLNEHSDWDGKYTGFDCLVFLIRYYKIKQKPIPKVYIHTTNPNGLLHLKLIMDLYKAYKNNIIIFPTLDEINNYLEYYNPMESTFDVDSLKHFTKLE